MANIERMRVTWSGAPVTGDGLSTFYFKSGSAAPAAVKTFFTAMAPYIAAGVSFDVPTSGDVIDEATGGLTGVWAAAGGGVVASSGNAEHAQGVGARLKWLTGGIVGGRRVVGSTFLVPIHRLMYDTDGTLAAGLVTAAPAAGNALVTATSPNFVIWSRPTASRSGTSHPIVAAVFPDKVSWLRSRRV